MGWGRGWSGGLLVLLSGCTSSLTHVGTRVIGQQTPIVSAYDGGSAELQILACPRTENAALVQQSIDKLLLTLQTAGLLVSAQSGNAKLIIDLCAGA